MPKYQIEAKYDMGMSMGAETYVFDADNDVEARKHVDALEGGCLDIHKRNVRFDFNTLSRVMGTICPAQAQKQIASV